MYAIVKRCHPGMKLFRSELSSVLVCGKFFDVPFKLWIEDGFSYVANVIGSILDSIVGLFFQTVCIEI